MPFATLSPSIPHSRSFFRRSGFFSGGEGCEWRAPRATVGESGDKAENEFSGFSPLAVPRKGFSPHIPASRLFVLFHPTGYYKIKTDTYSFDGVEQVSVMMDFCLGDWREGIT
jgi:hypothetical protein